MFPLPKSSDDLRYFLTPRYRHLFVFGRYLLRRRHAFPKRPPWVRWDLWACRILREMQLEIHAEVPDRTRPVRAARFSSSSGIETFSRFLAFTGASRGLVEAVKGLKSFSHQRPDRNDRRLDHPCCLMDQVSIMMISIPTYASGPQSRI